MSALGEADAILICVPTPLTDSRDPDLSYIEATARADCRRRFATGQLVVLESTTYPGTTRDVVCRILAGERPGSSWQRLFPGLQSRAGRSGQSDLVHQPGAESRGRHRRRSSRDLAVPCTRKVVANVVPVSSCEVAEASKILENMYRAVNIAMVNELKMHLRAARHRRVGSDRSGEDQAVRIPGVLSRARAWAGIASPSIRSI